MPTVYDVIYLGNPGVEMDVTEGNAASENASALLGLSFGSKSDPLYSNIKSLSPDGSPGASYDTDNNSSNESFFVGGISYTMDANATYGTMVTFVDGTTAALDIKVSQTTTGEIFLIPFLPGEETKQAALEVAPIESITLTSVIFNSGVMAADRLAPDYVSSVDGTIGNDNIAVTYTDAQLDEVDGSDGDADAIFGHSGDDTINGGAGNDLIVGGADDDSILGGAGNDDLRGDVLSNGELGSLNFENTGNILDGSDTETLNTRAVELVKLDNGDLIMITSERGSATDNGIRSYQIDNTPGSPTYGQVIATNNAIQANVGGTAGYDDVEDMVAVTTSAGDTFLYTADPNENTIGVTQINSDGSLSRLTAFNQTNATTLDEVQELSHIDVGGNSFLLALSGGSGDNLQVFQIASDGSLTQTDIANEQSGANENFLDNSDDTDRSMLESFTNSAGETFVVNSGTSGFDDGIALWTLDNTGTLTFHDARGDNDAGADSTDEEGNALGRDLINPTETALDNVNAATFVEIEGETYLITGDEDSDDNVSIWRIDTVAANDFVFTLVGQANISSDDITSMETLHSDDGVHIVVGSTTGGLQILDVVVNGDNTVSVVDNTTFNPTSAALGSSENMAIVDDILVSASESDDGVAIIRTGLNVGSAGNDTIEGGAGDDTISGDAGDDSLLGGTGADVIAGGTGADTLVGGIGADSLEGGDDADRFVLGDGFGSDTIIGGNGVSTGTDTDIIDASALTSGIELDFITVENGTITDGVDTITFSEIEQVLMTEHADQVSAALLTLGIDIDGQGGDDTLIGGSGGDTLTGGMGADSIDGGAGDDTIVGGAGNDMLLGGAGNDTITAGDGNDSLDGGAGNDVLTAGLGSDTVFGGAGDDTLTASSGAGDTFFWIENDDGTDVIAGFAGGTNEVLTFSAATSSEGVTITYSAAAATNGNSGSYAFNGVSGTASGTFTEIASIEGTEQADIFDATASTVGVSNASLRDGDDLFLGSDFGDTVTWGAGANTITAGAGDDLISSASANADNNVISAGAGNDTVLGTHGSSNTTVDGGAGNDSVSIAEGDLTYVLNDSFGDDTVSAADTGDTVGDDIDASALSNAVTVSFSTDTNGLIAQGANAVAFEDFERFTLTGQADSYDGSGSTLGHHVDAGAGDDTLGGGVGADTLLGGAGADTFTLQDGFGTDTIAGGTSGTDVDRIDGSGLTAGVAVVTGSGGAGTLISGSDTLSFNEIESFNFTAVADTYDGSADAGGVRIDALDGNDSILGGAGNDTFFGGLGDDTLTGGDGDDLIDGGAGDDFLRTGEGNDTLLGGDGNDTLMNSAGDDSLVGGAGNDSIVATLGNDTLEGGDGNDTLDGGEDNDSLEGGAGDDVLIGGSGNDHMDGGADADTFLFFDGFGTDTVFGGETGNDFDTIDLSNLTVPVTVTFTGDEAGEISDNTNTITFSQIESIIATDQNDLVDASAATVGTVLDLRAGNDSVDGTAGQDSIMGGTGDDTIDGGAGDDTLEADAGNDLVAGGTGNDSITGASGNDTLEGGVGNDSIDGGADDDSLAGGDGTDTIIGGLGNDTLTGGQGNDVFTYSVGDGDDTITDFNVGNTGALGDGNSTNNDFIDLSAFYTNIAELRADYADNGVFDHSNFATADYSDNTSFGGGSVRMSNATATTDFTADNTGVTCFTSGTGIRTPRGEVLIEDLRIGDLIDTADNGPQPIRWIGRRSLEKTALCAHSKLRPVLINQGVLGNARPLLVSQQHGLILGDHSLVRAKHLAQNMRGVRIAHGKTSVTYIHLMFDAHQIIFANGTPSESFYPGTVGLQMMHPEASAELFTLFPNLQKAAQNPADLIQLYGQTARPFLSKKEVSREMCL